MAALSVAAMLVVVAACATPGPPRRKPVDPLQARLATLGQRESEIRRQLDNPYLSRDQRQPLLEEFSSVKKEEELILIEQGKGPPPRTQPRAPSDVPEWDPHPY